MYCLIGFAVVGVIHSISVIFFAFQEDIVAEEGQTYDSDELKSKRKLSVILAIMIQVMFYFMEMFAFFLTYLKVKKALNIMLQFHDYLIEYRLTPRSRVLRKHLPKMTMVLEEDSNMDQSSMMMSQSRIMSVSNKTITSHQRRKFVYKGEQDQEGTKQTYEDEISEDESESDSQSDLE